MNENKIAYKFVEWEIEPLAKLFGSFPYLLKEKVLNDEDLNRKEKNQLYSGLQHNAYNKRGIPLQGWMFDFSNILKEFFVEFDYGSISKVYAPDKTAIRNNEKNIKKIVEII